MSRPVRVPITFDIETCPADDALVVVDPFDPSDVKLGNLKDKEKIANKINEARQSYADNILDKAALSPITGRVIAIGVMEGGYAESFKMKTALDHHLEKELIEWFWEYVRMEILTGRGNQSELVGYNCFEFDLPFLMRRSWKLKIDIPDLLFESWERRPMWNSRIRDAMIDFSAGVWQDRWTSLNAASKFLGYAGKSGEVSGKNWHKYIKGDHAQKCLAEEYLRNDLWLCAKVHMRTANDIRGYS